MKIAPFALSAIVGATASKASGNERILKKADLSQSKVTSAGNIAAAALTPRGGEIGHRNRGTLAVSTHPHRQLQSLLDLSQAPVTASSVYGDDIGYRGTQAFDNNMGTRWTSKAMGDVGATVNEWLEVDLGETHDITKIDLYWERAHARQYQFQVSSDRTNWTVHTETISSQVDYSFWRTSNFSANGRYVRFYGTEYSNIKLYSIWEMKIYGTAAAAAPPPVTPSPSKSPTNAPTGSVEPTAPPSASPSKKPTGSPTGSPSKKPTASPTTYPTNTPPQSPTHSPWKLAHASGNAEYNKKDEDEGTVTSIWDYYSPLLSEDDNFSFVSNIKAELCSDGGSPNKVKVAQRSEGVLTDGNGVGVGVSGSCSSGLVTTSGQKSCVYRFDKSLMNSSVGYTPASGGSTANQELCEIAQLQYKGMVLTEFYTDINVQFSLEAGFNVTGVEMTQATISTSNQETSLADYVSAAKCDGGDLGPNQILCIDVTSSSNDIKIETLDSMTMIGNAEEGRNSLVVVNRDDILTNNGIQYTAITSVENEGSGTVRIQTRVPTSTFDFQAPGAKLNINGAVTLKFADESRRLVALNRLLQANEDESAQFEVAITLQSEKKDLGLEGAETMMNSARATTGGKVFVIVGMAIASAFALW